MHYIVILYIYSMLVREIWACIHPKDPRVSYSPEEIWYSWVNKFSYFLNPHAINVLLYQMKPRKHIHVKYCWQTYLIKSPLERCLRHLKTTSTAIKRFKITIQEKTIWPIRNMALKPTFFLHLWTKIKCFSNFQIFQGKLDIIRVLFTQI